MQLLRYMKVLLNVWKRLTENYKRSSVNYDTERTRNTVVAIIIATIKVPTAKATTFHTADVIASDFAAARSPRDQLKVDCNVRQRR